MAVLVDLERASVRRSDEVLFEDLSLTVSDGDRIGVVGINGTGKSTLLRVIAGADSPQSGEVRRARSSRIGFLEQNPTLGQGVVRDQLGSGWERDALLERLGMGTVSKSLTSQLSGGQSKRVALAAVLSNPSDLLVLDEPTNHLDIRAIAWLEGWLLAYRGGLVVVSHDRRLLDRVTNSMLELDRGHSYMHEGGYESYLTARAERAERAVAEEATRRNLARRELTWLSRGAPARTRKPRARINAALSVVEGRPRALARPDDLDLSLGTRRLGSKVIECTSVSFGYEDSDPDVLRDVNLVIDPGDRLAIVGANGSGKSTLLDLIAGRKTPRSGRIEVGSTVVVGYYDQKGMTLDLGARVRDLVAGSTRVPGSPQDVALMERFWFGGELGFARVGTLSGGERRRLQLLLVLVERPNVLLLDEPTNDLDLDTLRAVEGFFEDWSGALVVVSHDRTLLERTTDRIVALQSNGTLSPVTGGLEAWLAQAEDLNRPQRTLAGRKAISLGESRLRARSQSTVNHELREVERKIGRLSLQLSKVGEAFGKETDHVVLSRLGVELTELQRSLAEVEDRWLVLSEEAESLRRGGRS